MQQGELVDEHGAAVATGQPYRAGLRLYYYRSIDDEPRLFEKIVRLASAADIVTVWVAGRRMR